jgi:hypothetical protein
VKAEREIAERGKLKAEREKGKEKKGNFEEQPTHVTCVQVPWIADKNSR